MSSERKTKSIYSTTIIGWYGNTPIYATKAMLNWKAKMIVLLHEHDELAATKPDSDEWKTARESYFDELARKPMNYY